jgi:VanZ family protein
LSRPLTRWGPPLAWASLILIATSISIPETLASVPESGPDKLVHGALYGVLAWLLHRAFDQGASLPAARRTGLLVFTIASLFGAVDEWHQEFLPGRSAETADWIADSIGAGIAVLAFQTARRRREPVS